MKLDILTLAFVLSLICVTQTIALYVQYRVDRTYRGIGWWLLGALLMAMGFIFMPMLYVPSLQILARIANPLAVLGEIFLYYGVVQFLNVKEKKWILPSLYVAFILSYLYYMYIDNDISGRTVVVASVVAIISLMTAAKLFTAKDKHISGSAAFTAGVFLVHGSFSAVRVFYTLLHPTVPNYSVLAQTPIHVAAFIIPILASTLWTFGFIIMVNQRLNAENHEEKEQLQMIFNTSPDAASITTLAEGIFVDVNAGFLRISGCSREEVIGKSAIEDLVWLNISDRQAYISEMKEKGYCENLEFTFKRKDGIPFVGLISGRIIPINDQPHIYSVVRDITERKTIEAALQESEEMYRSILNASPDDITITDLSGRVLMVSQAAKKMFGFADDFEDYTDMKFSDFIVPEDLERAVSNIKLMFTGAPAKPNEYRGIRKDGSIFDIEVNSGLVRGADGSPIKIIIIARDISVRKQTEQQVQALFQQLEIERNTAQLNSITDSLTELANRRYLDEVLNKEFYRLKRSGAPLSLIMLDVDHFKAYNDNYGHIAGDNCLRQIGVLLKTTVGRIPDIAARYGGEEFLVILPETDKQGAEAMAQRIRIAVEALRIPHAFSETSSFITVSLGVVTVHTTDIAAPETVVSMADEAMYSAKQSGRNRISIATTLPFELGWQKNAQIRIE